MDDGDPNWVIATCGADLLQEIKITESEILHLKKKSRFIKAGKNLKPVLANIKVNRDIPKLNKPG